MLGDCYRPLFDWLRTDPARDLVSALYFGLSRTREARSSTLAPVWWEGERWESALAANVFAVAEDVELRRAFPAWEPTDGLVVLRLGMTLLIRIAPDLARGSDSRSRFAPETTFAIANFQAHNRGNFLVGE